MILNENLHLRKGSGPDKIQGEHLEPSSPVFLQDQDCSIIYLKNTTSHLGQSQTIRWSLLGESIFPFAFLLLTSVTFINLVKIIHTEECSGARLYFSPSPPPPK